jgi:hypothetical protein
MTINTDLAKENKVICKEKSRTLKYLYRELTSIKLFQLVFEKTLLFIFTIFDPQIQKTNLVKTEYKEAKIMYGNHL